MADKGKAPIIVKKKKGGHGGAHGGAWKVAYADFVTAMMCFFMVMWLMGADEETKSAVASYFNNPTSALRVDMASNEVFPLGDKTGAGDSVLRGADGQVPEALVEKPSRPILEGNTHAQDESPAQAIVSSGDQIMIETMKFSVLESALFDEKSSDQILPEADKILARLGLLSKANEESVLVIRGWFDSASQDPNNKGSDYEFRNRRLVALKDALSRKKIIEEFRLRTQLRTPEDWARDMRAPSSTIESLERRIEFSFERER